MTTVNYYDATATQIVRTRDYETRAKALAAIKRANAKGKIAALAQVRTTRDQPTTHS